MTVTDVLEIAAAIITSLGGGSALVFGLSNHLGRVWADRALEKQRQENARLNLALTHQLALDAEKFKAQIKANADTEIERVKAFLTRASRVHERQLEILQGLYRHLFEAQGFFQRMTASARFGGEISREEYESRVVTEMESARDELSKGRLFIPPALAQSCDGFFDMVFQGRLDFSLAHNPMLDAAQQTKFWTSAATVAHTEVPKILQQIEEAARSVIHGEQP